MRNIMFQHLCHTFGDLLADTGFHYSPECLTIFPGPLYATPAFGPGASPRVTQSLSIPKIALLGVILQWTLPHACRSLLTAQDLVDLQTVWCLSFGHPTRPKALADLLRSCERLRGIYYAHGKLSPLIQSYLNSGSTQWVPHLLGLPPPRE